MSKEYDDKQSKTTKDIIDSILEGVIGGAKKEMLADVQKIITDAASVSKSLKFSGDVYEVFDINRLCIAYVWYNDKKELEVVPLHNKHILQKRMN